MKLNQLDLERAVKLLPQKVQNILILHDVVVAGGYLRSVVSRERIKDIDIFSRSKEAAFAAYKELREWQSEEVKTVETKNALSIMVDKRFVQFIYRWVSPDPESLIKSFDFTIAKAAIWYDKSKGWDSLIDENFYPDIAAKRLTYTFPDRDEEASGSLLRVLKFVKKGYNIPSKSLAGVVARVAQQAEKKALESVKDPYSVLYAPYGKELEKDTSDRWTKIIHGSISSVTGES